MRTLSAILGALLLLPLPLAAQADYEIVLRVNDRIATSWDYHRRRLEKIQMIQAAESLSQERRQRLLANIGVSTMDEIFEELLMMSRADQLGIQVTEADLDRAVNATRQNAGIETQEQFEQALQSSNLTLEKFRENLSGNLLVQKLMSEEVHPRITLEEEDLRRYYQNHLEDFQEPERLQLEEIVLLAASGSSEAELQQMADDIREQVQAGGIFQEVVQPLVEQEASSSVVDLGWVEIGDLDPDLEQAVWNLQAGEVSETIAGRGGLHVLRVVDRQEARLLPFAGVEQQIRATEGERLLASEMQRYLEELETAAFVKVNPPPDAAGFRASLQMSSDTDDLEQALTAPLIADPTLEAAVEAAEEEARREAEAAAETDPDDPPID